MEVQVMAIIIIQCKWELWLIDYLEYNQGSDLRTALLPGLLLTPMASTQLSNKIKAQSMSCENVYKLPAHPPASSSDAWHCQSNIS